MALLRKMTSRSQHPEVPEVQHYCRRERNVYTPAHRVEGCEMRPWKTPEGLRVSRIEKWAEARFKRRLKEGDIAAAMRAANFYTAIACRADGIALSSVTSYR
jgi:hypothetical protein